MSACQMLLRTELRACPGLLEEVPAVVGNALGKARPIPSRPVVQRL